MLTRELPTMSFLQTWKRTMWNFVIMSGKKLKIGNLKEQEAETNFFRLL